ncbi:hypothetical protein KGM_215718A, partial [Danaus plexippus plexippus]
MKNLKIDHETIVKFTSEMTLQYVK